MTNTHLVYGGSTAARTIACPAWVRLSADLPKDHGSNTAADTGTLLHNCMEEYLEGENLFSMMLEEGREYNGIELTKDMVTEKLDPALVALYATLGNPKGGILNTGIMTEPFVQLSDEIGGSIDVLAKSEDGKTVHVIDYKFGFVSVSAVDNAQLKFYALCAATDASTAAMFAECETISMTIIQPNMDGPDYETWTMPYDALDAFEDELLAAVNKSKEADCAPAAGAHCKYCPAAPYCPTKKVQARSALALSPARSAQLGEAMAMVSDLETWCKEIKNAAHTALERGAEVPGFKLVQKRATRVWTEPDAVTQMVRNARTIKLEEAHTLKLLSPAQLEKVCKSKKIDFKRFQTHIASVSTGTTLAPESDKRTAVTVKDIPDNLLALVAKA